MCFIYSYTGKSGSLCSFLHLPEWAIDSKLDCKAALLITTSLYFFLPKRLFLFPKLWFISSSYLDGNKLGEKARAVQREGWHDDYCLEREARPRIGKGFIFSFLQAIDHQSGSPTLRFWENPGIRSILRAERLNNFLSLILMDEFAIDYTQLDTNFKIPYPINHMLLALA